MVAVPARRLRHRRTWVTTVGTRPLLCLMASLAVILTLTLAATPGWSATAPTVGLAGTTAPATGATTDPTPTTTDTGLTPLPVDDPAVTSGLAWHLDAIGARGAWRASLGASVTVAVVDTGVDHTHPDLAGQVRARATCLGTDGTAKTCTDGAVDTDGHGTHVAGLIAARADDGFGVVGVAPRARLLAVRAATAWCPAERSCPAAAQPADLAAAIRWSVAEGADIVNLSVDPGLRLPAVVIEAIDEAWAAGSVVVLAAGNSSSGPLFFATGAALLVTATDRDGNLAPYAPSLDGARVGVAAPGGREGDTRYTCHVDGRPSGVVSTDARSQGDRSGHACQAGTSMAAAQVSGALALLLSMGFTRDEALERLVDTARPGPDLGDGLIDLAAAVAEPHPVGVGFRHDGFDNGTGPVDTGPVAVAGPFARATEDEPSGASRWLAMAAGAALMAGLAEVAMRRYARRSSPAGPDDADRDPPPGSSHGPGPNEGPGTTS